MKANLLRIVHLNALDPLRRIVDRVAAAERDLPPLQIDPRQPELFRRRTNTTRLERLLGERERAELERRAA